MRLFTLLLVIAVGFITGYTVVKFVHVSAGATAVVNIQLVAFVWAIATLFTGLWLMRRWIAWQWSRFTAWLELRLVREFVDVETRWPDVNERRLDLIDRELDGSLTIDESAELDRLQVLADVKFRPLHQEALRRLDAEIGSVNR